MIARSIRVSFGFLTDLIKPVLKMDRMGPIEAP